MSESQTPRTDAERQVRIFNHEVEDIVPTRLAMELESELTATRARLAEEEGIAEKMHEAIEISKVYGMFILPSAVKAYEAGGEEVKIAVTVSDFAAQAHTGADIERTTWVIDVPEDRIPPELQASLQQVLNPKPGSSTPYFTISISLLKE